MGKKLIFLIIILIIKNILANTDLNLETEINNIKNEKINIEEDIFKKINVKSKEDNFYNTAVIVCLNKLTTNAKTISINIGESEFCGNLKIEALSCYKNDNDISYIALNIEEHVSNDDSKSIFKGWLISNNPAISTSEHQIYEIFAYNCINK